MSADDNNIATRKAEHLKLCASNAVAFKAKTNGFEFYDFVHDASTEIDIAQIDISTDFFGSKISAPFLISCMTGGTNETDNINLRLASVANRLNIPLGIGSQRYALNSDLRKNNFKEIRKTAGSIPILSNIGAAQVCNEKSTSSFQKIVDDVEASAIVIHLNPLQELLQREGEPNFPSLQKKITKLCGNISVPVLVKEVGSGISKLVAKKMLDCGVKGIDVAGAGGTSWAGVEILRNNSGDHTFWDWGLPTSYCIRTVNELKSKKKFLLIGSGGISNGVEISKAIALGADLTASARTVLNFLINGGEENVYQNLIHWFNDLKKIMFLTNSKNFSNLKKNKLIRREELY